MSMDAKAAQVRLRSSAAARSLLALCSADSAAAAAGTPLSPVPPGATGAPSCPRSPGEVGVQSPEDLDGAQRSSSCSWSRHAPGGGVTRWRGTGEAHSFPSWLLGYIYMHIPSSALSHWLNSAWVRARMRMPPLPLAVEIAISSRLSSVTRT